MKKLLLILMIFVFAANVCAVDYFTDRMNFPPGESRTHVQNLSSADAIQVNATVPEGFSLSSTSCTTINSTFVSCTLDPGVIEQYVMTSPNNCTEPMGYKSYLTSNSSFDEYFTFVCIPDYKITDCKIEYGHGDSNYLDTRYISTESVTLFNLLRVWNIGHYLIPNENARDATIDCRYENYPVRTYGRVELTHDLEGVNGTFYWSEIEGGYWFRIGVVSQDVYGMSIGDFYNVTCNNLTYQYDHHQVIAESAVCDLEARSTEPITCTAVSHPVFTSKAIITLQNTEKYNIYDISFDKRLNDYKHTETYALLNSGQSVSYIVDNSSADNITVFFVPSWFINSVKPVVYMQNLNCFNFSNATAPTNNTAPELIVPISNYTWPINTNLTDVFDLDDHFTDADGDPLTYYCDNVTNITIIIAANNSVSFIPDFNWTGQRNTTCYANDGNATTPSNEFTLTVFNCGDGFINAGEDCDGVNLDGKTCATFGYSLGTLVCNSVCLFDTSNCSSPPPTPPTPSSCFPAGTKIIMSDKSYENIEDVEIGDYVLSYDGNENKIAEVLELESPVRDHMCRLVFSDSELELTNEHPVYTSEGWKSIEPFETAKENSELDVLKLEVGDYVKFIDEFKELLEIECWYGEVQTYNLKSIEKYSNFYADNILVHNKGGVTRTYACSDGRDNDGDGLIDYPNDPGCYGTRDDDEYDAPPPPPEEESCVSIEVITVPDELSLEDDGFSVFLRVKNPCEAKLTGITVGVSNITGWCFENQTIGDLNSGESKIIEFEFENCNCNYDYVVVHKYLQIPFIAGIGDVWSVDVASMIVELPEITVLTDRKYYFEDDIMRLCIIYNNTDKTENMTKLEYEINVYKDSYEKEDDLIVDYLASYYAPGGKVLVVIKDYWIHDVINVNKYIVRAVLYQKGELFEKNGYYIGEGNNSVVINGFIEDQILQRENTIYEFRYQNEVHTVFIESFDENYVYLSVTSKEQKFKIRLLETVYVDLDNDEENDISLTYLGIKSGKADVRIRLVPKVPDTLGGDKDNFVLNLGEYAPIKLAPSKLRRIAPIAEGAAVLVGAGLVIWFIIWLYLRYEQEIKRFIKFKGDNKKIKR